MLEIYYDIWISSTGLVENSQGNVRFHVFRTDAIFVDYQENLN